MGGAGGQLQAQSADGGAGGVVTLRIIKGNKTVDVHHRPQSHAVTVRINYTNNNAA